MQTDILDIIAMGIILLIPWILNIKKPMKTAAIIHQEKADLQHLPFLWIVILVIFQYLSELPNAE